MCFLVKEKNHTDAFHAALVEFIFAKKKLIARDAFEMFVTSPADRDVIIDVLPALHGQVFAPVA
jgi:hypothetical protein